MISDVAQELGIPWAMPKQIGIVNGSGADRVAGDVLMFDLNNASGLATDAKMGTLTSIFTVCVAMDGTVAPGAGGNFGSYAMIAILAEDIADGLPGQAYIWGSGVRARVLEAMPIGAWLQMPGSTDVGFAEGVSSTYKAFGFPDEASLGAGFINVTFNGIYGFGVQ